MALKKTYDSMQDVVLEFLHDHFYLTEGLFEPVDEESFVGCRRFGWNHYMIHNVEVALLMHDENPRFTENYALAAQYGIVGIDSCFIEVFAPNFYFSTVMVLKPHFRDSVIHPGVPIRKSTAAQLEHLEFVGDLSSALAYFTFAKLAK